MCCAWRWPAPTPRAAAIWSNTSTGDAVRGRSAGGYGLAGYTDDGYAVYGQDAGTTTARGYGGYFTSQNGVGVYGASSATPYYTNMHVPGVYGSSANGVGVYGAGKTGVRGESVGPAQWHGCVWQDRERRQQLRCVHA